MGLSLSRIASIATSVVLVLAATVLHEVAHAACANALGDSTAKERGRLTLNPMAHLDPVGSIALPLLMAAAGGPIFAFAKPVPYDPRRLRRPVRDEVLVALAGPACNLVQALAGTLAFHLVLNVAFGSWLAVSMSPAGLWAAQTLATYVYLNLMLMFFNLVPLPPLDGSAIISPLLKGRARMRYYQVQRYAMPVLLCLLYVVPMVLGVDPLGAYLDATAGSLANLLLGL